LKQRAANLYWMRMMRMMMMMMIIAIIIILLAYNFLIVFLGA
jgi:hypothetical protein